MITSIQNPSVKQMRKLHSVKERRKQNLILLEGTHLVESACEVHYSLVSVFCTPSWQETHPQLWENACQKSQRAEIVTPEILKAIATTVNPDGVVATAPRRSTSKISLDRVQLGLVLERLQDPGNLGTIIRTATAADVDALWLSEDSVDLENPKVLRSSAGEWFKLPMAISTDLLELVKDYRSRGGQVIATLPQASLTYWQIDFTLPTLILLGNEGGGLTEDLVSFADKQVKIPLAGGVESLNAAIAAALLLYEAKRQKNY